LVDVEPKGSIALIVPMAGSRTVVGLEASDATFNAAADRAIDAAFDSDEPVESCALDVIDRECGPVTLQSVGDVMSLTRERVRQIEAVAMAKLESGLKRRASSLRTAL
jgi:hypothetical protein